MDDADGVAVCSCDDEFVASVCGYVYAEADGVGVCWVFVGGGFFYPCDRDDAVACDSGELTRAVTNAEFSPNWWITSSTHCLSTRWVATECVGTLFGQVVQFPTCSPVKFGVS